MSKTKSSQASKTSSQPNSQASWPIPQIDEKSIQAALPQAQLMKIKTKEDFQRAGEIRKRLKDLAKEIDQAFKPIIDHAKKMKAFYLKPVEEALEKLDSAIQDYLERARLEAEKKAQAEKAKLLAKAEKLESKGQELSAEGLVALAETVQPKTFLADKAKTEDLTFREEITYEIFDEALLPDEFIIRQPNRAKISAVVREKGLATEIPGVRVFTRLVPVSR